MSGMLLVGYTVHYQISLSYLPDFDNSPGTPIQNDDVHDDERDCLLGHRIDITVDESPLYSHFFVDFEKRTVYVNCEKKPGFFLQLGSPSHQVF